MRARHERVTVSRPLEAYSKVTSTGQFFGSPSGRSRITVRPMAVHSPGRPLSPSSTCSAIERWFSRLVANRSVTLAGSGVFRGISTTFRFRSVSGSIPSTPRLCELTLVIVKLARSWSPDSLASR